MEFSRTACPASQADQLRHLVDAIQEFIVLKDGQGRWLVANQAVIDVHDLQDIGYLGRTDLELGELRPQFRDIFEYNARTDEVAWQHGAALTIRKSFLGLDGRINTWEVVKTPHFDAQGQRHQLIIVSRNITDQQLAEDALRASEAKYRLIAENMSDIIGLLTADGKVDYVSPSIEHQLGYRSENLLGRALADYIHPLDRSPWIEALQTLAKEGHCRRHLECRVLTHRGWYRWYELTLSLTGRDSGNILGQILLSCREITERKRYDEQLQALAYRDPLTNVANRRLLLERMGEVLQHATQSSGAFAVLYLDLDKFKPINDAYGHALGDRLLIALAERIDTLIRPIDLLARIGGDEFVVLLRDVTATQAEDAAKRLCDSLQQPWLFDGISLRTTSSIGIALYPEHGDSVHALLRHADQALYSAKRSGRARIAFHGSESGFPQQATPG
jgi:diguanylate cyclase (GGDEF)-like protein/PAS domain S-box-containing protein